MKKSTIWSIIVVAVLALGGAGVYFYSSQQKQSQEQTANSSYSSHMQAGKEAVKAKKYSQAADEFDQAYQAKATAQAKNYQAQAENLANSIKLAKTTVKYASALNLAQKAQEQNGGYSVMTSQAKKLVKQLKAVKDNYDSEIKPLLNKAAKAMEDGDYDSAASTYSSILDLPYINGAYYAKVRSNVKDLLKEAKSKQEDSSSSSSSSDSSSKSSSKESSSSSSSTASSSASSSSNQAEGSGTSNNDKVGGSTVTSRDVQQIRTQLDNLGESTAGWSPQDLINLFNYAYQQGHTTIDSITKDDVEGYLKSGK
jgi:tetratricopeptide (TPR) repeat protein